MRGISHERLLRRYFGGRHVIVTGGSSGIGLATAARLADLGAELTLIARRPGPLQEARERLASGGQSAVHALPLDVSREEDVGAVLRPHLVAHPPDMLFNNAGIVTPGRFLELPVERYREMMNVNYFAAVFMCRQVLPLLIARGGGHVANVGSLLSAFGLYGYSAYAASKFALLGFSESIRGELAPYRVRVSVVLPPDTDTPMHHEELALLPPETRAMAGSVKMLSADDVAQAMLVGMARGRFEIIPGLGAVVTVRLQRWAPSLARRVLDSIQRRAGRRA